MICISIQPFAFKKMFALGATLLCLSTASCFADAMFLSSNSARRSAQAAGPRTAVVSPASFARESRTTAPTMNSWFGAVADSGSSHFSSVEPPSPFRLRLAAEFAAETIFPVTIFAAYPLK